MVLHYYNEIDPYAAQWIENLISAGLIPPGDVDRRSIEDVTPEELERYTQCHFFAGIAGWPLALGIAGWPLALGIAGWPVDRPVWTGSCPCQSFSSAGAQKGQSDERHLWPTWKNLIGVRKPPVIFGEQVDDAITHGWLDEVAHDLEEARYAIAAAVLPACCVGSPHPRERLFFVADTAGTEQPRDVGRPEGECRQRPSNGCHDVSMEYAHEPHPGAQREQRGRELGGAGENQTDRALVHAVDAGSQGHFGHGFTSPFRTGAKRSASETGFWDDTEWVIDTEGKARPVKSGLRLLAHGVPGRVGKLRALGNAIIPEVAAEFIGAYMELGR